MTQYLNKLENCIKHLYTAYLLKDLKIDTMEKSVGITHVKHISSNCPFSM